MKNILSIFFICLTISSCTNICKDVNGEFSQLSTSIRYTYVTRYKFSGNNVELMAISKTGNQDYKSVSSPQEGSFKVDGEKVIANFGGSDITLNINRSSEGCIESLSNDFGTYIKK